MGAIRDILELKLESRRICVVCKVSKQKKMSHKGVYILVTTFFLNMLHMDLMGPMQVESFGGKRCVFVCVNDFSCYGWVNFIREKSDTSRMFDMLCIILRRKKDCKIGKIV